MKSMRYWLGGLAVTSGLLLVAAPDARAQDRVVATQQLCETLHPAATIDGRVVSLSIRYCGEFRTQSSGRAGYGYLALMDANGAARPLWPNTRLLTIAQSWADDLKDHYQDQDASGLLSACYQVPDLTPDNYDVCGQVMLALGRPADASAYLAHGTAESRVDRAFASILAATPSGLDWAVQRDRIVADLQPLARQGDTLAGSVIEMLYTQAPDGQ